MLHRVDSYHYKRFTRRTVQANEVRALLQGGNIKTYNDVH